MLARTMSLLYNLLQDRKTYIWNEILYNIDASKCKECKENVWLCTLHYLNIVQCTGLISFKVINNEQSNLLHVSSWTIEESSVVNLLLATVSLKKKFNLICD